MIRVAWLTTPLIAIGAGAMALSPRWRADAAERLGWRVAPVAPGCIWVHGASVGEIAAAEALVAHLPGPILLTADTDTGAVAARLAASRAGGRVVAQVKPIDHPATVAPLWAEARPRAVVFIEGTWWPVLATIAERAGIPVFRASAKAGARTRRWPHLERWRVATHVIARDESEAAFFVAGGASVSIGGDLKLDRKLPDNPLKFARPYVVAVSTRPGDEAALCDGLSALDGYTLVLAPRHPERFDEVAALVPDVWRRSQGGDKVPDVPVVLLDTLGELAGVLRDAHGAYIGGTFDPAIGGHSPAEAVLAGVPIVVGPHQQANRGAYAGGEVHFVSESSAIAAALARVARPASGKAQNGAGARTAAQILARVGQAAPEASPRPWARPLTVPWGAIARWRDREVAPVVLGVPVISVGSTNARGPGKTSTARFVAEVLCSRGFRVGIATRGYGRTRPGSDVRLSSGGFTAADLGDEGAYLAGLGFLVAAGPDRVEAGQQLVGAGCTAVVLDDGLLSRRLFRDVDIAVVDARFPDARGMMPEGERRLAERLPARVSVVVVHHSEHPAAIDVAGVRAQRRFGPWQRAGVNVELPPGPIYAFAGVARPGDVLASLGRAVAGFRDLGDHAPISPTLAAELIAWAGPHPLVTTAKDLTRLPEALAARVFVRDVALVIDDVDALGLPWPIGMP